MVQEGGNVDQTGGDEVKGGGFAGSTVTAQESREDAGFYAGEFPSDKEHLHYARVRNTHYQFSGFLKEGLPDGDGEIQWSDGHGYSGSFCAGKPHGKGTHFYPDGKRVTIQFVHGCPEGEGVEYRSGILGSSETQTCFDVKFGGGTTIRDGAKPHFKEETFPEPHEVIRLPFAAFSVGKPRPITAPVDGVGLRQFNIGNYPNIPPEDPTDHNCRKIVQKFVWARPKFADQPLWNTSEVRGKIVGIMRGPLPPATNASFSLKVHYAQQAGAVGVIIVDWDPKGPLYRQIRTIDEGAINFGVWPIPDNIDFKVMIPTIFMQNKTLLALKEDEDAWMVFSPESVSREGMVTFGYQIGFVVFPPIQNKGLRKQEANSLMAEFLQVRKMEREKEKALIEEMKFKGHDADESLKSREFYGGSWFESMNPFKQVKETHHVDAKVKTRIFNTFAETTGFNTLQTRMRVLQRDLNKAIPVQVRWEEIASGGLKVPVFKVKEGDAQEEDVYAWSFMGKPPCHITFFQPNKNYPFSICFHRERAGVIQAQMHHGQDNIQGGVESFWYYGECPEGITWLVSIDNRGFHVALDGEHRYTFNHRLAWNNQMAEHLSLQIDPTKNLVEWTEMSACDAILPPRVKLHLDSNQGTVMVDRTVSSSVCSRLVELPEGANKKASEDGAGHGSRPPPVDIILKLDLDFKEAAGNTGTLQRQIFEMQLIADLSSASGATPQMFDIYTMSPGSIIVHAHIHPDPSGKCPPPEAVAKDLELQASTRDSPLCKGKLTSAILDIAIQTHPSASPSRHIHLHQQQPPPQQRMMENRHSPQADRDNKTTEPTSSKLCSPDPTTHAAPIKTKAQKWADRAAAAASSAAMVPVPAQATAESPVPAACSQTISTNNASEAHNLKGHHLLDPVKSKLHLSLEQSQENRQQDENGPAATSKVARWAARAGGQQVASTVVPAAVTAPLVTTVRLEPVKSKLNCMSLEQSQENLQQEKNSPAATSKVARWAARAGGQQVVSTVVPAAVAASQATTVQLEATPLGPMLVQGLVGLLGFPDMEVPTSGSAMEVWMQRAAANRLHLPWHDKFFDYEDEVFKLHSMRLTVEEIIAQRRHLNPPDIQRSFSSIRTSVEIPCITGLGWARSCLDSRAAWCPAANDESQWMEIDLLEEMQIYGLVTQGQAATNCSGTRGICVSICPPPHKCKGGGEINFTTEVQVMYRILKTDDFKLISGPLKIGRGGDKRQETVFSSSVRARYVRIQVMAWEKNIALRAGIIIMERKELHDRSPFSCRSDRAAVPATDVRASTSKKAIDRSLDAVEPGGAVDREGSCKNACKSAAASGPAPSPALTAQASPKQTKAQKWASRAAAAAASAAIVSVPAQATAQSQVPAASMTKAQKWAAGLAGSPPEPLAYLAEAPGAGVSAAFSRTPEVAASPQEAGEDTPFYAQISTPELTFSGYVFGGVPCLKGSLRFANGAEYHGMLEKGIPHGQGTFYLPDRSKLSINFTYGSPEGRGKLTDSCGQLWMVEYDGKVPMPMSQMPEPSSKVEICFESYTEQSIDCVAISVGLPLSDPENGKSKGQYPNVPSTGLVKGKLVLARPEFGDMPLWNAEEVQDSIAVILCGPSDEKFKVSSTLKIHHAQVAGAKAVILVDRNEEKNGFQCIPWIKEGPIDWGIKPNRHDLDIKIKIPVVVITGERANIIQEGAMHVIRYVDSTKASGSPYGFQVGFVERRTAQKEVKAEELMRTETLGLLRQKGKSKMGGKIHQQLVTKMEELRQDFEAALPVAVTWNDDDEGTSQEGSFNQSYSIASLQKATGIKVPNIVPKCPTGKFVWSVSGEGPMIVHIGLPNGDEPFCLTIAPRGANYTQISALALQNAKADDPTLPAIITLTCRLNGANTHNATRVLGVVEWTTQKFVIRVAVNERGYHVTMPCIGEWKDKKGDVLFLPHSRDQETLPISKLVNLATLPLVPKYPTHLLLNQEVLKNPKILRLPPNEGLFQAPPKPTWQWNLKDWTLVFRQTVPFTYSPDNDYAQAKLWNENDPSAENYSILDRLEDFRCKDGKFTMLLMWPKEAVDKANVFRQSSNPVTMDEMGVDNYQPHRIDFDGGSKRIFGGLQRTDRSIKTKADCFIDGCHHHEQWFFSIGVSLLQTHLTDQCGASIPGPGWNLPSKCVELYVTTKDIGIAKDCPSSDDLYCMHGVLKSSNTCPACKDPLSGYFTIDHSPYYPCTSGHGPRWIWDQAERGHGRKTLRSQHFFKELEASDVRAFKLSKWPLLYNPDFDQNSCSGYHNFQLGEVLLFSGFLQHGLPDGMCSLRWSDGSEYHGEFLDGEMTGYGRYIFPDKSEFRGDFHNALPGKGMYYPPGKKSQRFVTDYAELNPKKPLWEIGLQQICHKQMLESPLPRTIWNKADCLAIVKAVPGSGGAEHAYDHIKPTMRAQLVWARPIYADQPLWNAEECQGKIVAIMRGPRPPAPPCNYSIKLFHAQNAGALAVIFVDFDSFAKFSVIPRIEDGPIYGSKGGPILHVKIPCFLTLNELAGVLQEGALHSMILASRVPPSVPAGWKIGFIFVPQQENKQCMSKEEEQNLMEEFFTSRRRERAEENELLQDQLDGLRAGVNNLDDKEFVGGALLDSLNFAKQDCNAPPPKTRSGSITQAMLEKLTSKEKAEKLAQNADVAAKIFGDLMQGVRSNMTGEAAADEVIKSTGLFTPSPPQSKDDLDASKGLRSGYKRSQSQPKERTDSKKNGAEHLESPSPAPSIHTRFRDIADHADTRKAAEQLRRERDELLARLHVLQSQNEHLKQEQEKKSFSSSISLPVLFNAVPSPSSLFAAWSPSSKEGPRNKTLEAGSRASSKPEWL